MLDKQAVRLLFSECLEMFELFDIEKDPLELNNLAAKPELKQIEDRLKARLQKWMILNEDYLPLPIPPAAQTIPVPVATK
ncbi:MAG: sulfatase/phosphatase domain-containing protein [Chryseolinea sp.]